MGQLLGYPTTLAKQLDFTRSLPFEMVSEIQSFQDYDLELELNTNVDWIFTSNTTFANVHLHRIIDFECNCWLIL